MFLNGILSAILLSALLPVSGFLHAQQLTEIEKRRTDDTLSLPLYKSGILNLAKVPSQVSVGNPGIADILILKGSQVHVVAKALGSTNVVFWDKRGSIFATVDIEVTHDLDTLKEKLHTLLPDENIGIHSAQENIVLTGTLSNASNLQAAINITDSFLPECIDSSSTATEGKVGGGEGKTTNTEGCKKASVVNMMSVGGSQQVMLEVKVAEVARTFMRTLDSDLSVLNFKGDDVWGAVNGGASWPNALVNNQEVPFIPAGVPNGLENPIGPVVDKFDPVTPDINDAGLFFSKFVGDSYLQLAMEISRSKGLSKILAEPNLTTLTGKPAKFVSGGEFPISVVTEDGIEVTYKEFGVLLEFLPTILGGDRISLDLDVGVSDLRVDQLIGGYPIIDKRGASTSIELKNGQTIGIAGLIQDDLAETFTKLPGLGDIPLFGTLFRSQNYLSGQTELVIFVTPHLAKPISPDLVKLPTESFVPPSDFEFYVLGQMSSSKKPDRKTYRKAIDGGFDGVSFGHKL